jgi:hypothetical protein
VVNWPTAWSVNVRVARWTRRAADVNGDGTADAREGKDIAHRKALSRGGSNNNGVRVESSALNRSFKRNSSGALVSETSKREKKLKK